MILINQTAILVLGILTGLMFSQGYFFWGGFTGILGIGLVVLSNAIISYLRYRVLLHFAKAFAEIVKDSHLHPYYFEWSDN